VVIGIGCSFKIFEGRRKNRKVESYR